jgi:hypothetical protein
MSILFRGDDDLFYYEFGIRSINFSDGFVGAHRLAKAR